MMGTGLFEQAVRFAAEVHAGMTRKVEEKPYLLHPLEVAAIAGTMTNDPEILAAAVLHDVAEDTETGLDEIGKRFGKRVEDLVASETEDKMKELPPDRSWRIRKEKSLRVLEASEDPAVKILWVSDKLSNMRSFYEGKLRLGDRLWDHFNQPDPAMQAWYYRTVVRLTEELSDKNAWKEFAKLTELVFGGVK